MIGMLIELAIKYRTGSFTQRGSSRSFVVGAARRVGDDGVQKIHTKHLPKEISPVNYFAIHPQHPVADSPK
jgi:hypothetical protein